MARLVYNDGLITVFAFGGIYASTTFGFSTEKVIVFGITLNIAAGLGALAFGYLDDKLGGRTTIMLSLVGLIGFGLTAVLARMEILFWIAGLGAGLLAGPNQSASRSLMGRFTPDGKRNEFLWLLCSFREIHRLPRTVTPRAGSPGHGKPALGNGYCDLLLCRQG